MDIIMFQMLVLYLIIDFFIIIINNFFKNLNLLNKYLSLLDKNIIFFSANNDENTLITKSIE